MKGSLKFILGFFMMFISVTMIESNVGLIFVSGIAMATIGLGLMCIGTKELNNA